MSPETENALVLDADWIPEAPYRNPRCCADPVEYHQRVMRHQQRQAERKARRVERIKQALMLCTEYDNCFVTDDECAEICRDHWAAGLVTGLAAAAVLFILAGWLVCQIY